MMRENNVNENCYQMKSNKSMKSQDSGGRADGPALACAAAFKARASKASMLALN
jgi:hypothetical protein